MLHIIKLYFPFLLFFVFSFMSILLFAVGPIYYEVPNPFILYLYLSIAHIAIFLGYRKGLRSFNWGEKKWKIKIKYVNYLGIFVVLVYLPVAIITAHAFGFNLLSAIESPGVYRGIWHLKEGTIYSYLLNWASIFNYIYLSLVFAFWNKLRFVNKLIGVGLFLFISAYSIATGSRHGLWACIVFIIVASSIGIITKQLKLRWSRYSICIAIIAILSFSYFSYIAYARSGYRQDYVNFFVAAHSRSIDINNPMLLVIPDYLKPGLLQGYQYITHGYLALAYALDKPFVGISYGFGQGSFLTRRAIDFFGKDFSRYSYKIRLYVEDGFPIPEWITSYPWIASDVTFPGSIVVLFLLAWVMGNTWANSIFCTDPIAVILCGYMTYCFNQMPIMFIVQDPVTFIIFYGLIGIYLIRLYVGGTHKHVQYEQAF